MVIVLLWVMSVGDGDSATWVMNVGDGDSAAMGRMVKVKQ